MIGSKRVNLDITYLKPLQDVLALTLWRVVGWINFLFTWGPSFLFAEDQFPSTTLSPTPLPLTPQKRFCPSFYFVA